MIGKFFHTPKGKKFNIPYRFHDPEKEEMEAREQRVKREMGIRDEKDFDENYKANLRGTFRQTMGDHSKSTADARRRSNTRVIFLVIILALVFYLFFFKF